MKSVSRSIQLNLKQHKLIRDSFTSFYSQARPLLANIKNVSMSGTDYIQLNSIRYGCNVSINPAGGSLTA